MLKLNKNTKKIIFGLIIFALGIIVYYIYMNIINSTFNNDDFFINTENNNIENKIEESSKENNKNTIIVHISGAVQREGIIEIDEESRIVNAIERAGGLKENACIKDINLASKIEDGEKIYIPTLEEFNKMQNESSVENNSKEAVKNNEIKTSITRSNKININSATQHELESLPGIGSTTALKIITYRKENGKFKSIEEIKKVNGIGENKYKEIKDLIVI